MVQQIQSHYKHIQILTDNNNNNVDGIETVQGSGIIKANNNNSNNHEIRKLSILANQL